MTVQAQDQAVRFTAFIEQTSGEQKGRVFPLQASRLTLGRASENNIVVDVDGVSRVHALIVNSDGSWFIRDNKSKNGLFVNGEKVNESWLETGDVVQLGNFIFRFDAGAVEPLASEADLPDPISLGGPMEPVHLPATTKAKGGLAGNRRILLYAGVLLLVGAYFFLGSSPEPVSKTPAGEATLARDFKMGEKPSLDLGTNQPIPSGMEDPLLKEAEQEMTTLDWSNASLRESEQFFRRGQREYLNKNYHRAIDSFQAAISLYGGHLLAQRYLRLVVYEVEMEAKNHMAIAVHYYESLQYQRSIQYFNEVIALMAHRPQEPIVKEAARYIKQAELRLQAAELFP